MKTVKHGDQPVVATFKHHDETGQNGPKDLSGASVVARVTPLRQPMEEHPCELGELIGRVTLPTLDVGIYDLEIVATWDGPPSEQLTCPTEGTFRLRVKATL